jgi:TRAP transporter TAXI family solute receptor
MSADHPPNKALRKNPGVQCAAIKKDGSDFPSKTWETKMKSIGASVFALGMAVCVSSSVWAAKISMETATANSVVGLMPQAMAPIWDKAGISVELAMGQTLTKSLLKVGQGTLDTSVMPPPAYGNLVKGAGPYAKMGDKATELSANVVALWGFSASQYHPIVWGDKGINAWADIKGKRVYLGPPAGAANAQIKALIKAAVGYEEGKDYTAIKAPWGVAPQSFQDGQFDVLLLPAGTGAQVIQDMASARPLRILPMPAGAKAPEALGLINATIPKGTYKGVLGNEVDIPTWQTVMMVVANKKLSDAHAYLLTKTYMDNREALGKSNALLRELRLDSPLSGVIAPLHPGAYRYYKEAGIQVPQKLQPR